MSQHGEVGVSVAGSGVTVTAAIAHWLIFVTPMLESVSLMISIVAGALTIVYTLKKIFEKKK